MIGLQAESADDDDCNSNKSLDLNFGKKLIDFKLSPSSGPAHQEQPASSSSAPAAGNQDQEKSTSSCSTAKQQPDYKHVCRVCKKSFRYATTLARHERAHLSEEVSQVPAGAEEDTTAATEEVTENNAAEEKEEEQKKEAEGEEEEGAMGGGDSEGGESEESEEEKEKEERSDEEATEPKSSEGGEVSGRRVDKRKKICNVCGKRFWSLQDLTRHMRSHTGMVPVSAFCSDFIYTHALSVTFFDCHSLKRPQHVGLTDAAFHNWL